MTDSTAAGRTGSPTLDVALWHVHGSWSTSFVGGPHRYAIPVLPQGGEWGRGFCGRRWGPNAVEVSPRELAERNVDVVVLQRPHEVDLFRQWTGRKPGVDVPAVYVEHNTPKPSAVNTRHPMADRRDIPVVHVTDFNRLMWDNGAALSHVVRHGIPDPGPRYTGSLERAATMINEPIRRGRTTGTDLLRRLSSAAPTDVYGLGTAGLELVLGIDGIRGHGDVQGDALLDAVAQRRVYVHTPRWTSLGLSLLEAMHMGMPVVALATTEAPVTVPPDAGVLSNDLDVLASAIRCFAADHEAAALVGKRARAVALERHGLHRFLADWNRILGEVTR
ncbi:glycosyltransferase [Rhodococcus fascians]|nr:glycosyltransferase [Rhodococcus fascians]MBY4417648.1 glycosyltransferase [Rhodococcus fascians]